MKNLILASILGSAAAGFAVPALTGPVHFAITRPYSMFGSYASNQVSTIGVAPLDFVVTDITISTGGQGVVNSAFLTVNGVRVIGMPTTFSPYLNTAVALQEVHLSSGVYVSAGSTVGFECVGLGGQVSVVGFVQ